jgi:hypothetical protein
LVASVGAVYTAQLALLGRDAISAVGRGASAKEIGSDTVRLPDGLRSGPFSDVRIGLNTADAQTHLAFAIAAGNTIIDALETLKRVADLADHASLVSTSTALTVDNGTRVSRLNLEAQAGLIVGRIDTLVNSAQFRSANLISSSHGQVRIQTTHYGGSLGIIPQPLDSIGLGIGGLNFLTDQGVDNAAGAINTARSLAGVRVDRLKSLQSALGNNDLFASNITDIIANSSSNVLPRGSVVNVTA